MKVFSGKEQEDLNLHLKKFIEVCSPFDIAHISQESQRKMEVEKNVKLTKMMTQLDLITKYVMGTPTKVINAIVSKGSSVCDDDEASVLNKEVMALLNYLGVFRLAQ